MLLGCCKVDITPRVGVELAGFGPFLALRALDQVHTNVAYQNIPVRIVNTHSGLTSGGVKG